MFLKNFYDQVSGLYNNISNTVTSVALKILCDSFDLTVKFNLITTSNQITYPKMVNDANVTLTRYN